MAVFSRFFPAAMTQSKMDKFHDTVHAVDVLQYLLTTSQQNACSWMDVNHNIRTTYIVHMDSGHIHIIINCMILLEVFCVRLLFNSY